MPCVAGCAQHGKTSLQTPLERYATSLGDSEKGSESSVDHFFPMYTLPVATLMKMDKIKPHEELLAGGELTIFQKSLGKAAFVSHQWIGKGHPDPEFKQMQVLQDSLQNLISGTSEVNVDLVTEAVYFRSKGINASEWQAQNLYLWYDYFSCPQAAHVSEQGLQKAISSIPSYVSRCDFFVALCPVLSNPEETETFSEHSWAHRGWCRVERVVYELTFNQGSWIMVKSAMHQELRVAPLSNCSPGEGSFTVESDRDRIGVVLAKFVKKKLLSCLENMNLPHYRFLLNQQTSILRGLPVKPIEDVVPGFEGEDVLERFMYQNGFQNPFDYDSAGWSPMCYACMKGDVPLVAALLKQRIDPNEKIKKARAEINLDKGCSLIHICARFKNHEAMQLLFAANAAVSTQAIPHFPVGVAALENDPIGIRLLCSVSADPRKKNLFGDHALHMAIAAGAEDATQAFLSEAESFDLSRTLHTAAMFQGTAVLVRRLIEASADVDEPYLANNVIRMLHTVKGIQYTWGRRTMLRRVGYHGRHATPLMIAILCGNFEAASSLLVEGANVNLRNARGKTAKDLANELRVPDYLLQAMDGAIEKCISIAGSPDSPSMMMAPSMSRQSSSSSTFAI
ncbi:Transient receptor potential channel pyrexia [Durusdinium trenchii]|uniref:Transient receptor potential channel pyrexia n=1 Tax=Durusdinium trenchii TaxID=1381693 RepID=A0ABP0PTJ0_9DINO